MLRIERRAFLAENLKRIVCNSFLVRDELLRYFPGTNEKIRVVHNGVEWNEFTEAFAQGMEEKERSVYGYLFEREYFISFTSEAAMGEKVSQRPLKH